MKEQKAIDISRWNPNSTRRDLRRAKRLSVDLCLLRFHTLKIYSQKPPPFKYRRYKHDFESGKDIIQEEVKGDSVTEGKE